MITGQDVHRGAIFMWNIAGTYLHCQEAGVNALVGFDVQTGFETTKICGSFSDVLLMHRHG
jgi:hypothetical protein